MGGFGLIGYVPNTLYTSNLNVSPSHSKYILYIYHGIKAMKKFDAKRHHGGERVNFTSVFDMLAGSIDRT
jgi:hypothetical protein